MLRSSLLDSGDAYLLAKETITVAWQWADAADRNN